MPDPKSYPVSVSHGIFGSHRAALAAMARVINESKHGDAARPLVVNEFAVVAMVRASASVFLVGGTERDAMTAAGNVIKGIRDGEGVLLGRHLKVGSYEVDTWPSNGGYGIFSSHSAVMDAMANWIPILYGAFSIGKERGAWAAQTMDGMVIAAAKSLGRFGDDAKAAQAAYQHFLCARRVYLKRFGTEQAEVA